MADSNELAVKLQVTATSTGNITLSGEQTLDGVAVKAGERALVRAQTTPALNGIWLCANAGWYRADDFTGDQATRRTRIYVKGGTTYGGTTWELTNSGTVIIGNTGLTFALTTSPVTVLGVEETDPDGTETFAIEDSGTPKYVTIANAAKGMALGTVGDVTVTSVADKELLAYDSASGEWINQTAAEAGLESADPAILKDADIGVTVQAYDADTAKTDVAETISARWAFNGGTSGVDSPFTVDSTFVVANLNADLLDGSEGAEYAKLANTETVTQQWTFSAGIDLSGSVLSVDGTQVVTSRQTGWTAATGTAARTTWTTFAGQTITNPPTQTEVQNIDDHVVILSQRLKALTDDLITHGIIGST